MKTRLVAQLGSLLIVLSTVGCCGIPNVPAKWQVDGWVGKGMPPGTSASAAVAFLESKDFVHVFVDTSSTPHVLRGSRQVGMCFLNFTYDTVDVTSVLDRLDRVVSTKVTYGVEPGI